MPKGAIKAIRKSISSRKDFNNFLSNAHSDSTPIGEIELSNFKMFKVDIAQLFYILRDHQYQHLIRGVIFNNVGIATEESWALAWMIKGYKFSKVFGNLQEISLYENNLTENDISLMQQNLRGTGILKINVSHHQQNFNPYNSNAMFKMTINSNEILSLLMHNPSKYFLPNLSSLTLQNFHFELTVMDIFSALRTDNMNSLTEIVFNGMSLTSENAEKIAQKISIIRKDNYLKNLNSVSFENNDIDDVGAKIVSEILFISGINSLNLMGNPEITGNGINNAQETAQRYGYNLDIQQIAANALEIEDDADHEKNNHIPPTIPPTKNANTYLPYGNYNLELYANTKIASTKNIEENILQNNNLEEADASSKSEFPMEHSLKAKDNTMGIVSPRGVVNSVMDLPSLFSASDGSDGSEDYNRVGQGLLYTALSDSETQVNLDNFFESRNKQNIPENHTQGGNLEKNTEDSSREIISPRVVMSILVPTETNSKVPDRVVDRVVDKSKSNSDTEIAYHYMFENKNKESIKMNVPQGANPEQAVSSHIPALDLQNNVRDRFPKVTNNEVTNNEVVNNNMDHGSIASEYTSSSCCSTELPPTMVNAGVDIAKDWNRLQSISNYERPPATLRLESSNKGAENHREPGAADGSSTLLLPQLLNNPMSLLGFFLMKLSDNKHSVKYLFSNVLHFNKPDYSEERNDQSFFDENIAWVGINFIGASMLTFSIPSSYMPISYKFLIPPIVTGIYAITQDYYKKKSEYIEKTNHSENGFFEKYGNYISMDIMLAVSSNAADLVSGSISHNMNLIGWNIAQGMFNYNVIGSVNHHMMVVDIAAKVGSFITGAVLCYKVSIPSYEEAFSFSSIRNVFLGINAISLSHKISEFVVGNIPYIEQIDDFVLSSLHYLQNQVWPSDVVDMSGNAEVNNDEM